MRIHILIASVAALAACGGSAAPVTSSVPDASSDVSFDHNVGQGGQSADAEVAPPAHTGAGAIRHPSQRLPEGTGSGGSSSGGIVDAGARSEASTASCGPYMCAGAGYYCKVTKTNSGNDTTSNCEQAIGCPASGANCGCVDPFDGGTGCKCTDNGGLVTLTCNY